MTQRHASKAEAANVAAFVDATVAFETNVSFQPLSAYTVADIPAGGAVLLLAPATDAAKAAIATTIEAFGGAAAAAVKAQLEVAAEGKLCASYIAHGDAIARVQIGLVPTKASRHNCSFRPDAVTPLVAAALGDVKKITSLDVISFFPVEAELAIATAVARAALHSFKSQGKAWESGYKTAEVPAVRVLAQAGLKAAAADLAVVAKNVQLVMRLLDAPTNLLDTEAFAEIAQKYAAKYGFGFSAIKGEDLRDQGYGGIHAVGKAAEFPPILVTLSHSPQNGIDPQKKIALVGKGMVYDTGGLAIKTPAANMNGMKSDMGGAAAVFGGFLTAVQLKAPIPLDCVLCLADNAIGPRAFRNNDIVIFKSGRTCEVNNTDAEGRLILSDGVYHAAAECGAVAPSVIIDMATLTGAQGIATGVHHAAVYTDSEEWETKMVANGKKSGDLLFPILFCPEFHEKEYESKVADTKNLMARVANAGVSCAGHFINANLPKDFKGVHVHVDLAFPAFQAEQGTGYGVALLAQTLLPNFQ
jgi:probable aminopeptidase NPEPL1